MKQALRNLKIFPHAASLFVLALFATGMTHAQQTLESKSLKSKPNIVFILADDFGYGSLNSYGADEKLLRTPHIDQLADEGMRFTNANTPASICSPTRYGFLTGRYIPYTKNPFHYIYF